MDSVLPQSSPAIQPASIMRARFGNGRVTYPVKPSQALYARFEHVAGLPSSHEDMGLSLSKLRSIDILIDRLVHLKKTAGSKEQRMAIDSMIEDLEAKAQAPQADLGAEVQKNAEALSTLAKDASSIVKRGASYAPRDVFQGLLFNISA